MMDIATIFQNHFADYVKRFGPRMPSFHFKAIKAIMQCRTRVMGGEVYYCESCRQYHYAYHSCKNRHCPKCGNNESQKWVEKQKQRILPVDYFMVTFTIPQELRFMCRSHQKLFYSILFKASSDALKTLLGDPEYAGGKAGFIGILHTWTRQLMYHPHIHFIVPAGAFDVVRNQWNSADHEFLVPVMALSKRYRRNFDKELKKKAPLIYQSLPTDIWRKKFISNSKSVGKGDTVLEYLARYLHRVAISNNSIIDCKDGKVTFKYKESGSNKIRYQTVTALEFMRRFLQHVLPVGFQKIRYYGFLNAAAKSDWEKVKAYFQLKELFIHDQPKSAQDYYCPTCKAKMTHIASYLRKPRAPPLAIFEKYLRPVSIR
ncbi:MAG: IS91 family transposase [Candidatus Cloacimonetes bacterium]|jgi:Zn finger protein HypA/HybF involved in hydrogenase expression|nr:IS91 family transposase [Candidatus Cloacimonadota bacterium]